MMALKVKVLAGVALMATMLTFGGFIIGVIHLRSLGVCLGYCDEKRHQEFNQFFTSWFERKASCLTPDRQLKLLSEFDPVLYNLIGQHNTSFSEYRRREVNGTFSVGEREHYLSSKWRVQKKRKNWIVGNSFERKHDSKYVVRQCVNEGFLFSDQTVPPTSFCSRYVYVAHRANYINTIGLWSNVRLRAYLHILENGNVEDFIHKMKSTRWDDFDTRKRAKELVRLLPANQVAHESVEKLVQAEFLKLRCPSSSRRK